MAIIHPPSREWFRVPQIFQVDDLLKMHKAIENKIKYLKNDWGIWMKARDHAIISLMYECALRPRECLSLRFDDFDANLCVRIRPETNKERKGRVVPIPHTAIPFLKAYLKMPRERFWQGSGYLFPSFESKQSPLTPGRWKGRFRAVLKASRLWIAPKTGIMPPLRSYTLRISKATHMLEKNHDIHAVQMILGHAKTDSTLIYTKLTRSYQEWMRKCMAR